MDEQEQGGTIAGGNEMPEGTQGDPALRGEFADTQRVDTSGGSPTEGGSPMGGGTGMGAGQGSTGAAMGGQLDDAMLERAQEAGDPVGVGDTGTGMTDEKIEEPPPNA